MIYTLKNNKIKVQINDFGAELSSIKKIDEDYDYMWQGNPEYWKRRAPILFPIVGKLIDNQYSYNGKNYTMTQHGFARDMTFEVIDQREESIAFQLTYNESTLAMYPFKFELIITYTLKGDGIIVRYIVKNLEDQVLPFSIGAHPAFNWDESSPAKFAFKEHHLESYQLESGGISLNKTPVTMGHHTVDINKELFKNDALILEDIHAVTFINGERSVEMIFNGFPYLGLWSKPTGAPFVCIEPWYGLADIIGHNQIITEKKGIQLLDNRGIFDTHYIIKIS